MKRNEEFEQMQEKEIKTQKFKATMDKKHKKALGEDGEQQYDLQKEEDIDKMIQELELEKQQEESRPAVQKVPTPVPAPKI